MRIIKISDDNENDNGIDYISETLMKTLSEVDGSLNKIKSGTRTELIVKTPKKYEDFIRGEIEDKISDVIAVGYKYRYFKNRVNTSGLAPLELEILFSALISADIDEDKRYVVRKTRAIKDYAIDGIYNFKLLPLKRKWNVITDYIPLSFTSGQLAEFVRYLIGEKRGKKAIVRDGRVYDGNCNLLKRSNLLPELTVQGGEIVREVILSASGRVEVLSELSETDRKYLKDYYGGKISFKKEV